MVQSQVCSSFHICFHMKNLYLLKIFYFHAIWSETCLGFVYMGKCAMSIGQHWMETSNHKIEKRLEEMVV